MDKKDIVIVGGGSAGMAAALAAYNEGIRNILIIERDTCLGGILNQCIHNGFGLHRFGKELCGPEYADIFARAVEEKAISVLYSATATGLSRERVVTVQSPEGIEEIKAGAVVLATGCRERSRGALNIPGTRPAGVFSAGTAQKLMNLHGYHIGKRAVILGSGDIGLIMARRLTLEGAEVAAVCELLPYSGGLRRNIVQCLDDYHIPLYLSTTVTEIHGAGRIQGVTVAKVDENRQLVKGSERYIECDTLLLSVGLIPENELARSAGILLDSRTQGASVSEDRETSMEGVFACGNALHVHDLVDYVSEEGECAGKSAAGFVKNGRSRAQCVDTVPGSGVRYVLPQRIHKGSENTELFLRVTEPMQNVTITVKDGSGILLKKKKPFVAPGEMEKLTIAAPVADTVTVSVEKNL